jgi:hypothetical protein
VISFDTAKVLLVSHGLHLDCIGGAKFSADYPYHLTQGIREKLGRDWSVLYLNACCGNVNHINVKDRNQRSGYAESKKIGRTLAQAACAARKEAAPISIHRVGARTETVQCPSRTVPKDVYEWAKAEMNRDRKAASRRRFNEPTPSRIVRLAEAEGTSRSAEIIVLRLGPVGIVGLPAEVFVEVGQDIKTHSILAPTLVIGLTGGTMGYVPHPRGYQEGGYEATYASARYDPQTPILWSDTATRLLKELSLVMRGNP